jgi:hypothetical protein
MSEEPVTEIISNKRCASIGGVVDPTNGLPGPLALWQLRRLVELAEQNGAPDSAVIKGRALPATFLAVEW